MLTDTVAVELYERRAWRAAVLTVKLCHGRQQQMLVRSKQLHMMQGYMSSNSTSPGCVAASCSRGLWDGRHIRPRAHQCASILQLLASEDQPLLVRGDACSISGWHSRTGQQGSFMRCHADVQALTTPA